MSWSQTLLVSWLQFACASALLLLFTQVAMGWIVQPAERIQKRHLNPAARVSFAISGSPAALSRSGRLLEKRFRRPT